MPTTMPPQERDRDNLPTMKIKWMQRGWRACVAAALMLAQTGCESAPKAGGMNQALADYNAQRFTQAHQRAVATQEKSTKPGERESAAYLAGLAAYQMGQIDEAERRLMVASRASNPETTAKAKVMLGQIRLDQRRPREAATYFTEAAPNLSGEDAAKCAYNASVAYQQAGNQTESKEWLARSGQRGPTSSFTSNATAAPSSVSAAPTLASNLPGRPVRSTAAANSATGFTLQVGAFKEKSRAQQAAAEAQKLAKRDGLGSVKIISRRDERGAMMYVVQFGWFPTRESAATARAKLGRLEYIVASAPS